MPDPVSDLIDVLSRSRRVLVTTHVRPDGDALGTTAALARGMRQMGTEPTCLLLSELPGKYKFLYDGVPHVVNPDGGIGDVRLDDYDALLVADTGTWSQLPGLEQVVSAWPRPKLVLDHHLTQQDWADVKLVDTTAAAAAEVAAGLLKQWGVALNPATATCLYAGIVSDTGWFQFASTSPRTFRLAADLMEAGADHEGLYQRLYQSEKPRRIRVQTRGLATLELLAADRLATLALSAADFAETGATTADTENLVNVPLQIATVEASLLFTEPPEGGPVRVSLRSKGGVDVAAFAQLFGGGGHARAAGMKIDGSLDAARRKVTDAMIEAIKGAG